LPTTDGRTLILGRYTEFTAEQKILVQQLKLAICMTEGCNYTTKMEPDQEKGYCEACRGNTRVSVLILAGLDGLFSDH
jgi:hypothetical protein